MLKEIKETDLINTIKAICFSKLLEPYQCIFCTAHCRLYCAVDVPDLRVSEGMDRVATVEFIC